MEKDRFEEARNGEITPDEWLSDTMQQISDAEDRAYRQAQTPGLIRMGTIRIVLGRDEARVLSDALEASEQRHKSALRAIVFRPGKRT